MSTSTEVHVPAGWYADPALMASAAVVTQLRWWNGESWSEHTAAAQKPTNTNEIAISGFAPATPNPRESAQRAEAMPLHAGSASSSSSAISPPALSASSAPSVGSAASRPANAITAGYEPFSSRRDSEMREAGRATRDSRAGSDSRITRVHTVSIWLIAMMPITQALLTYVVFTSLPAENSTWTRAFAIILPFVLYAALADQDSRLMASVGHIRTAPWMTALIAPPAYLAIRALRIGRTTGALPWPLVVWAVAQLAVIATWWLLDSDGLLAALDLLGLIG
jgi:hypothetical protein